MQVEFAFELAGLVEGRMHIKSTLTKHKVFSIIALLIVVLIAGGLISLYAAVYHDAEYMNVFKGNGDIDTITLPYPVFYSDNQNTSIRKIVSIENKRYSYTFYVPNTTNYPTLKDKIENAEACQVFLPYANLNETHPYVQLPYTYQTNNWDNNRAVYAYPLGNCEPDDAFYPMISIIKETSNYFGISDCFFKEGIGAECTRSITVYLSRSLTADERKTIQSRIEAMDKNSPVQSPNPFTYNDMPTYQIQVLFDANPSKENLQDFCKLYSVTLS